LCRLYFSTFQFNYSFICFLYSAMNYIYWAQKY
jgi:hypothetical protein